MIKIIALIFTLMFIFPVTKVSADPLNPQDFFNPVIFGYNHFESGPNFQENTAFDNVNLFGFMTAYQISSQFPDPTYLTKVYETPNYGGVIRSIAVTDTHVWYAGETTQTVIGQPFSNVAATLVGLVPMFFMFIGISTMAIYTKYGEGTPMDKLLKGFLIVVITVSFMMMIQGIVFPR